MDAGGGGSGGLEGEDGSSYRHRLSNVNFINMGHLQKIKCVVDNQVRKEQASYYSIEA